jgi:hypothetical protein
MNRRRAEININLTKNQNKQGCEMCHTYSRALSGACTVKWGSVKCLKHQAYCSVVKGETVFIPLQSAVDLTNYQDKE